MLKLIAAKKELDKGEFFVMFTLAKEAKKWRQYLQHAIDAIH